MRLNLMPCHFLFAAVSAISGFAEELVFTGGTDRNPMTYACGEPITFTIALADAEKDFSPVVGRRLVWTRRGDDGLVETGEGTSDRPLTVTTSIQKPGFVRVTVNVLDADGKKIRDPKKNRDVAWDGGAGADVNKISTRPMPKDFHAFWNRKVAELRKMPIAAEITELASRSDKVRFAKFKIPIPGESMPAQGLLAIPRAAKAKSLPIDVTFTGYGFGPTELDERKAAEGKGRILISVTRQGEDPQGDQAYYNDIEKRVCKDFCFRNNRGKPEDTDFFKMIVRGAAVLRWAKTFPEWNGWHLRMHGGSMGGYQALAMAAVDANVSECDITIPWCADFAGKTHPGRMSGWHPDWTPALDYLSLVHLAARVKCMVKMEIGLGDYICPPSGEVMLYNALKNVKRMVVKQNMVHGTAFEPNPLQYTFTSDAVMPNAEHLAKPDWVFGKISEAEKYMAFEPRLKKAFEFLRRPDLAALAPGRYEIDGDNIFALIQQVPLRNFSASVKPEVHRTYIDIQAPLTGHELYGYGCLSEDNYNLPFDSGKDIAFFDRQQMVLRELIPGEFAIFFPPYGAHAPSCRFGGEERTIKKVVVKVRKTGEQLYNGIVLPGVWPPKIRLDNTGAMDVPYLESDNIPKVIPIDLGRQLFVDDFLIEKMDGTKRIYGKPVKFEGNPVLRPETEIEINRPGNSVALPKGGGMWWDEKRKVFRLWYETGWCHRIAYAESADGINWKRPVLDIVPGTNRLLPDLKVDSWSVVYDPDTMNEDERWKLMNSRGGHMRRMDIFTSPDGIHWKRAGQAGRAGDRTTMFYNPFRKVWVYSLRDSGPWPGGFHGRNRGYFETADFANGSDWSWRDDGRKNNTTQWMQADATDVVDPVLKRRPQLYNFDAVAYESLMVGVREIHHGPENSDCSKRGLPKITDMVFAYSRDGFHFSCPDRTAAIASERWEVYGKKWDVGYVQPLGNICVIMGDELWFYYGAFGGNHTRLEPDRNNNCKFNGMYDQGCMGLAKMRRDGFAALAGGTVLTRRLQFSGRHMFVNVDTGTGGSLIIEAVDENGRIAAVSKPVKGNSVKRAVEWTGGWDLSALAHKPMRFRFKMENGTRLYAFWVSPSERGESNGYLAGGGPGYGGIRDM